jgi:hypothetical protein
MISAQVEITKERRITAERVDEYRRRCYAELSSLQSELSQIETGQTLAPGGREGRRVWVSGYRGNLRLHWRDSGGTYDQQLPIGCDVIKLARLKLRLIF